MKLKFPLYPFLRKHRYFSYWLEILTLFTLYFSTARLGLSFDAVSRFATLVWLPSGMAVAALLLFGYRLWPGILMGAFLVNLFNGAPLFVAVGIGIGNTLEALVATYLLKRKGLLTVARFINLLYTILIFFDPLTFIQLFESNRSEKETWLTSVCPFSKGESDERISLG